jgi:radical SAM superfamily enzyme YgiQ (UPF0313 family)
MNITLFDIDSKRSECINKDFMGGYGWAFNAGRSLPAKLINFVKKQGETLPLMSFGYLAAIFEKYNHKVQYTCNLIPSTDLVFISSSMVDYRCEIEWARKIMAKGIKVGFVGPFSGFKPELFLGHCDFIIKGEPEQVIYEIAKRGNLPSGIVESSPVEDLNSLPFPKWDSFPVKKFSYYPALKEKPFFPILASRGCVYKCNYCPYVAAYKYRERSVENVFDEIIYLKNRFNVHAILFRDPLFGANRDFVVRLCEKILHKNIILRWACETRLNLLDKELLKLMARAGLRVLNTGVESGDITLQRKSTRIPVAQQHQEDIVRFCDKLGIRMTAFYIIGLPEDTREGILKTIAYAKKLNTHVAQFFVHTPFPGTEYFEQIKGIIEEKDWQKFDCYTPVVKHKSLSRKEIIDLKEKAFLSYYYRPAYFLSFTRRLFRDFVN